MLERQGHRDFLRGYELWAFQLALFLQVSGLLKDLRESAHFFGFVEKESGCFFEVSERPLLGSTAGGEVEFPGVGDKGSAFLENLGGELNLHTLSGYLFRPRGVVHCDAVPDRAPASKAVSWT
jgi:hypothetical protein